MINVLQVIHGLNIGGAESFVYSMMSSIPEDEVHFDFLLRNDRPNENERLLKLAKQRNSRIFNTAAFPRHAMKNRSEVHEILTSHSYDVIHVHANALIYTTPIEIADSLGIKVVIHSHSSQNNSGGRLGWLVHEVNRKRIMRHDHVNVACSDKAGTWLFGDAPYLTIPNAVDVASYSFNKGWRAEKRAKLGLSDSCFVIGHVGRFVPVKNHRFTYEVFASLRGMLPDAELVLVGDGPLRVEGEKLCCELGIRDHVHFVGSVSDVNKWLSAFDAFLFPSLFEGLPFSLIEAQSAGLPILSSDQISREANVTDLVKSKDLNDGAESWALELRSMLDSQIDRAVASKKIEGTSFDSRVAAKQLLGLYKETA